ncbi:MAG: TolC family protein [Sulfurimonas sp.]|uniref:TolC family protein n=1 Tax=Sulfurimonas sp. TaxID=2022749 RepID=UPI0026014ABF|nr:TolC family protein [Sulfurimonas sp.]MCK9492227.1 TolC family protein [Sulfurimonas sp.]
MKVSYLLIALSLLCSSVFSQEHLEAYISDNKKEQFKHDYDKVEAQSSKLRDSWIAPLNLQYSYSKSNPYEDEQTAENAAVKMDQPIFASGGIYYGIKFAEASRIYSNYSIEVAQRKLVKDAISLLMQIKQMDLKIKKQELQIKNSEINLAQKQEQYLNGQLDSGFLDNAIIERNVVTQTLYDIQTNKERLISKFNAISDMSYENAEVPSLESLTKEQFLANNIVLDMSSSDIDKTRYNKDVTTAKYLPQVSFTAGYNWNKSDAKYKFGADNERDYYDYGIKISMPLDINTFRDIEVSRIDYLKSSLVVEDRRRELKSLFEEVMQNIQNFEKKMILSDENRELYEKLLFETKEMYSAGYKTSYDVDLLKNSVVIQTIDLKIFEIDKQLELLTLYEMYKR